MPVDMENFCYHIELTISVTAYFCATSGQHNEMPIRKLLTQNFAVRYRGEWQRKKAEQPFVKTKKGVSNGHPFKSKNNF